MSAKNSMLAFLGGAVAGAALALLFAPEKGEVTRRRISNAVKKGRDEFSDAVEEGRDKVVDAYNRGRNKLAHMIHEGREVMEEELEMIHKKAEAAAKRK